MVTVSLKTQAAKGMNLLMSSGDRAPAGVEVQQFVERVHAAFFLAVDQYLNIVHATNHFESKSVIMAPRKG